LYWLDDKLVSNHRNAATELLKKLGAELTRGLNISKIQLPLNIFSSESFPYRCSRVFRFMPEFQEELDKIKDDENLKFAKVISFVYACLNISFDQHKPFNPIWGETVNLKVLDYTINIESTVHHPPIINFYVTNSSNTFK